MRAGNSLGNPSCRGTTASDQDRLSATTTRTGTFSRTLSSAGAVGVSRSTWARYVRHANIELTLIGRVGLPVGIVGDVRLSAWASSTRGLVVLPVVDLPAV